MQRPNPRRAVSLADIASAVGVTEGTASRALNGYADISEATRKKVMEAAAALNYRPSPAARRLALGSVETVGYVLPARGRPHTDPFLSEMLDGISQALAARDWDLLVTTVERPGAEIETYRRLVDSGKVSGLIITRTLTDDPRIELLQSAGLPFVAHGRTRDPSGYAWLDIDNERAAADAVAHLAGLGHEAIALIAASPDFNFSRLRIDGYRKGMKAAGLDAPADYVVEAPLSAEGGHEAMTRLLALDAPPTGVVCVTDLIAIGAMRAVKDAGLAVPGDISVVGYDGLPFGAFADPPLTTMTQDVEETGGRLTEILLDIIDGRDPTEFQEVWNARLVRRASDGPPAPGRPHASSTS